MPVDNTPGIKSLRRIQLGRETTSGTKVKASAVWRGEGTIKNDLQTVRPVEDIGLVIDTDRAYIPSKGGTLTLESTPATFEQFPYLPEMGIKSVGTGVADGVGSGKIYTYPLPTTSKNSIATYSAEVGDDRQVEFVQYTFAESFKLSGKYNEAVMMSGVLKTRAVAPVNYTAATISFSTSNTISDSANGLGVFPSTTYSVRARGSSSNDGIFYISSGSTSTLTVSGGQTLVTEAAGSTVTLEQYFTNLTPASVEEILFNQATLYIDDVSGTIGTTQKSNTFLSFDLDFTSGWKGQATGDGRLDFSFAKVTKPKWVLKITFEHDGTATAEKAKWIAKTARLVRIKITGTSVTAGTTYSAKTLIIDVPGIYTDFTALENDDGNDTVTATLEGGYDYTASLGGQIIVVNTLSSLT